ncbi:MAG: hypothetical protein A3G87_00365 [Omnitrophica bacterium RIFCSPLOWO2_12_FULL_50_11]|nr:MAG: hypothetical protein A3G87_00365 [Omnitrophica bacterium RIFCSPLOWO2_12_FULL_50_11]
MLTVPLPNVRTLKTITNHQGNVTTFHLGTARLGEGDHLLTINGDGRCEHAQTQREAFYLKGVL